MQCGFCHRGDEVESVCEKLWCVNNVKTQCAAHWKCMVRINTVIVTTTHPPIYGHYPGQPALAGTCR